MSSSEMPKIAAVLGAGLQGCCAALALRKLGFQVKLYDKSHALMNRASLNQEGKIHLGFVYARDPSMITARTMIAHALQFAPAIESFVGSKINWEPHLSTRFYCGIHRNSTLTPDEHYTHFEALQDIYEELADAPDRHYLGRRPKRIWSNDIAYQFSGPDLVGAVSTEETAVDVRWMQQTIVDAVSTDAHITCFLSHEIQGIDRRAQTFDITGANPYGTWTSNADIVVNCLWEGQQRIDQALGFSVQTDWITRVKYGFLMKSIPELAGLPSLIITHGPFGDIVNNPHDGTIYLTWYPACMAYIGKDPVLPEEWEAACNGQHREETARRIYKETIVALSEYLPQLQGLELQDVLAGTIMGHGKTDISDRDSGLHQRHGIGVEADQDYYSIFTGKYTSAPANALALQEILS